MMAVAGGAPRLVVAALMVIALGGSPSAAWALCPNCLSQSKSLTPTLQLIGMFLLVPFVVAYLVFRVIRRAGAAEAAGHASPGLTATRKVQSG